MKTLALLAVLLLTPLSGDEVGRLVRQLDSPKLAEREAAEKSLHAAGPRVLAMLPDDPAELSAETAIRISRIRAALEQKMAVAWVQPTRVTLGQPRMSLEKLLQAVELQSGNRVVTTKGVNEIPISCQKLDGRTFWEFVVQVAEQAGLQVVLSPGRRFVELVPRKSLPEFSKLQPIGPFLLSTRQGKETQLEVQLAWEPRLEPIWLKLELAGPDGTSVGTYELNPTLDAIFARLTVPATAPISGTITGLIPGPKRAFRFPLAESGMDRSRQTRFAQVAIELLNVRMEGSELRLALRLRYDQAHDALESYRGWFFKNDAYLVSQKQQQGGPTPQRLEPTGMETDNRTPSGIDLIYRFKITGAPSDYTFVYTTPIALLRVEYVIQKTDPK